MVIFRQIFKSSIFELLILFLLTDTVFISKVYSFDETGYQKLQTEHFMILSSSSQYEMKNVGKILENYYYIISSTLSTMKPFLPEPIIVFYLKDNKDFDEMTSSLFDKTNIRSDEELPAGFLLSYPDAVYIITSRFTFNKFLQELAKQFTETFIKFSIKEPPLWFKNGLSNFFKQIKEDDENYYLGQFKQNQIVGIFGKDYRSVGQMLRLSANSSILKANENVLEHLDTQLTLFISFLFFYNERQFQKSFISYSHELVNGVESNEAFLNAFPDGIIPLQGAYYRYIKGLQFPFSVVKKSEISVNKFFPVRKISRAEIDYYVGLYFMRQHNLLKTQQLFSRGKATAPNLKWLLLGEAELNYYLKQISVSDSQLKSIFEQKKSDYDFRKSIFYTLLRMKKEEAASKFLPKLYPELKKDLPTLKISIYLTNRRSQSNLEIKLLQDLLILMPYQKNWLKRVLKLLLMQKKYLAATGYAVRLIQNYPNNINNQKLFLSCLANLDTMGKKVSILVRMLQIQPKSLFILKQLGILYEKTNNRYAALSYYKRYLKLKPNDNFVQSRIKQLEEK